MIHTNSGTASNERLSVFVCDLSFTDSNVDSSEEHLMSLLEIPDTLAFCIHCVLLSKRRISGVHFTKVFRTELGHKYILVECSVIALCLPVMSKISRYKLVCYK